MYLYLGLQLALKVIHKFFFKWVLVNFKSLELEVSSVGNRWLSSFSTLYSEILLFNGHIFKNHDYKSEKPRKMRFLYHCLASDQFVKGERNKEEINHLNMCKVFSCYLNKFKNKPVYRCTNWRSAIDYYKI